MQSLKKKFGKFAVSTEIASNVSGGYIDIDPWDDGGGGSGGWGGDTRRHVYCCNSRCDATCRTSESTANRICGGSSVSMMCTYH